MGADSCFAFYKLYLSKIRRVYVVCQIIAPYSRQVSPLVPVLDEGQTEILKSPNLPFAIVD